MTLKRVLQLKRIIYIRKTFQELDKKCMCDIQTKNLINDLEMKLKSFTIGPYEKFLKN